MATKEQPAVIKQTRAPEAPSDVKTLEIKDSKPDTSKLDKFAGKAYKDSMTNWDFFVKSQWKKESQQAVADFGNNPAQLKVALEKIRQDILPDDIPVGIKNQFMKDTFFDCASIMDKALKQRKKAEKEDTYINADDYAAGLKDSISTDFFNVLAYNEAEDVEKRPFDVEIYNKNKNDLSKLADLTDDAGKYYFSETDRNNMKQPNSAIIKGFNSYVEQKSLSELEQWENNKFNNKKEFVNDTGIDDDTYTAMQKSIEFYKNVKKREIIKEHNQERIGNSLSFMDNPVIYKANFQRADGSIFNIDPETDEEFEISKKLEEQANQIYSLSDKVGDGKVDPLTLQMISRQVASITVDDENTSVVDNNILKAFEADMALRKAGADRDQLATFHKLTQLAMTDTGFKQSVAALANKPKFDDTMFLRKSSRSMDILRPQSEDDKAFVENKGREAYFGAMQLMIEGNPAEALAFYDSKVQEAYDFIKKDIIDVEYVKNALANQGYAMVELNGNISKITGRLPNGEYIIEETGETINGGI